MALLARWCVFVLVSLAVATVSAADAPRQRQPAIVGPAHAIQFSTVEFTIDPGSELGAILADLPDEQIHDTYDYDGDHRSVGGRVYFEREGAAAEYALIFAMRDAPGGPWVWRARWMPTTTGTWTTRFEMWSCRLDIRVPGSPIEISAAATPGPLVSPGPVDDQDYLRERMPDGTTRACWLFGAARAWVVSSAPAAGGWAACEGIDRERDLFPTLRGSGYDLLNQWMAPWEYLLVHRDRAEFWRANDGTWSRHELPEQGWKPWACYDQGRAAAFDALVRACEGDAKKPCIRLLLSPLPHQAFQMATHAWGRNESGWSVEDDDGKRPPSQLNGFSAFLAPKPMDAWQFFAADSGPEEGQWPTAWHRRLFDAQANYIRYVLARWGSSRAIGVWVLIDELDGVGDQHGLMKDKTGWWGHPECDRWFGQMTRLLHGELAREHGSTYQGDLYHRPVHGATTSFITGFAGGANIEWNGRVGRDRVDLLGWHWYPEIHAGMRWDEVWSMTIDGIAAFSDRPQVMPKLISEFGAADRARPEDAPSALYPTLYHHALWAAIFSGQAGTPMDWDDGKEFGELCPRAEPGPFDAAHYPIDNAAQLRALRKFLGDLVPDRLHRCVPATPPTLEGAADIRVFALATRDARPTVRGWLFAPRAPGGVRIAGMPSGAHRLRWFDPWTGEEIPAVAADLVVPADGSTEIDPAHALAAMRPATAFPKDSREDRGRDAAFVIEPKP